MIVETPGYSQGLPTGEVPTDDALDSSWRREVKVVHHHTEM